MAKILLENIQSEAQEIGWKVISSKYTNLKTEMEFKCPVGHTVITTYEKWRRAHRCPTCEEKENNISTVVYSKPKGSKRLLSLDQSTHVSGYAIFEDGKLIHHGRYITDAQDEVKRINNVKEWLFNILSLWDIDYVWLEDIQYQDNHNDEGIYGVTVFKALAHLQGVLMNLCYTENIPCHLAHVGLWRSFNEIKGRVRIQKKENAQKKVLELYGITPDLDAAEAILIGRYGWAQSMPEIKMIQWE